jgi:stress response protein YsnF/sporulation protein YlmC with PRC-barrel domain
VDSLGWLHDDILEIWRSQMQEPREYKSRTLFDSAGQKVGTIEDVYVDQETKKPEWLLVKTGLFGLRKTFVPMSVLQPEGDDLRAPYSKDQITSAPNVGDEEGASPEEEVRLFQHYGIPYSDSGTVSAKSEGQAEAGRTPAAERTETEYRDASREAVDSPTQADRLAEASEGVQRHEEELRISKVRRPSELVRLHKWVETKPVSTSVELEHEEARIVREPVSEREPASQRQIGEEGELEIRLEREEPVVEKQVVPKERVRLEKDLKTEQQTVGGEVRKERVDVERDQERG